MAMPVNSMMASEGPDVYYEPAFRQMLESHMAYLRGLPDNRVIEVEPHAAYKYEGDLAGLLSFYQVPNHLHWVVMRLNNLYSMTDVSQDLKWFLMMDPKYVEALNSVYRANVKKIN